MMWMRLYPTGVRAGDAWLGTDNPSAQMEEGTWQQEEETKVGTLEVSGPGGER